MVSFRHRTLPSILLVAAVLFTACGGDEEQGRLSMSLSFPSGWESRIDMGVISAQVSTPYIGSVRIIVTCGGNERFREVSWSTRNLSLEGLDLEEGCDILAQAVTAGTVIMERLQEDVRVGSGRDVQLHLQLEESDGFSYAGSLMNFRQYHSSVLLGDDVLIIGGRDDIGVIESVSTTDQPMASTAYGCSLNEPRTGQHVLHDAANNQLFVFLGGNEDSQYEIIDLINNDCTFYQINNIRRRFSPAMYGGKVFLLGGYDFSNIWQENSLLLDKITLNEEITNSIGSSVERSLVNCEIFNERLVCIGGEGTDFLKIDLVEYFDLESLQLLSQQNLSKPKSGFALINLQNGLFVISGGNDNGETLADAEIINSIAFSSVTFEGAMVYPRYDHTATKLNDGTILIVGGGPNSNSSMSAEIFNPQTGTSREVPWRMRIPRVGHTANLLPDGRVLIIGGHMGERTIEVFNPKIQ